MQDWRTQFRKPFNKQVQIQHELLGVADVKFKQAQDAASPWLATKTDLEKRIFPKLDKWISDLICQVRRLKLKSDPEKRIFPRLGKRISGLIYQLKLKIDPGKRIFPKLDKRISWLIYQVRRLKPGQHYVKKRISMNVRHLEKMKGITKWHPYAWFVRFKIGILAVLVFILLVYKPVLVIGEIIFFIYITYILIP